MSREDALALIRQALQKVLGEPVDVSPEADLIEDETLDSLDGMVFLLELETASGRKFPEDVDLVEEGFYRVPKLVEFLSD